MIEAGSFDQFLSVDADVSLRDVVAENENEIGTFGRKSKRASYGDTEKERADRHEVRMLEMERVGNKDPYEIGRTSLSMTSGGHLTGT